MIHIGTLNGPSLRGAAKGPINNVGLAKFNVFVPIQDWTKKMLEGPTDFGGVVGLQCIKFALSRGVHPAASVGMVSR